MKWLLLILLPLVCRAQKNYVAVLDSFIKAEVAVNQFNGNMLVAKGDAILYHRAFGYRRYDTRQPLNTNSVFELQSLTKQFVALGIFLLKEQGKLTLTDSLRRFFPELPYPTVTIHQMLTHTSGLPDDLEVLDRYWNHKKVATNKDLIHILATHTISPSFEPGAKVEYSNTAYELLASIIEKASGLSYATFLQKYIFTPLGMPHSYVYTTTHAAKQDLPNVAYGYIYSDSLKRYILPARLPEFDFVQYGDGINGAGNVSSTTGDLFKWTRALKNHQLLPKVAQKMMGSPQSVRDSTSRGYWTYASQIVGTNELGNYIQGGGQSLFYLQRYEKTARNPALKTGH